MNTMIIAISGAECSGRSTIAAMATHHGYEWVKTEDVIKDQFQRQYYRIPHSIDEISAYQYSIDDQHLGLLIAQHIKKSGRNSIIDAITSPLQLTHLREQYQRVAHLHIMTSPDVREQRIKERNKQTLQPDITKMSPIISEPLIDDCLMSSDYIIYNNDSRADFRYISHTMITLISEIFCESILRKL